jgi:chromosomal replication initiator protein
MLTDHEVKWAQCIDIIKNNINPQSFKTWFEPIKAVKFDNNILTIQVPNKFFYEWLEEHYISQLKQALNVVLGSEGRLEYKIVVDNHRKLTSTIPQKKAETFSGNNIRNPFVIPGIKKFRVDSNLNPKYSFDTYIEGDCNKLARSAGLAISKKPGGTAFNPLVIYGNVGLGKTHLVQAIGNEVLNRMPTKNVLYITSERFTTQIIQAIKDASINDFINHYQHIDTLIVDDIQFLANKTKTQEIFFNIFNQLHQNGKQIILTSDKPPKDLEGLESRLINRFKWGLSADISEPDFETRYAILDEKLKQDDIEIPQDVKDYICFNIKDNIRELEGVIITLIAQATLNSKVIDVSLAQEVIKQFVTNVNKEISVNNIKQLVADHFELPVEKLHSKTRKRSVVIARQLSMYLAKNFTNSSLKSIGNNFGGRDHSTVIYSLKAVQDLMDTDSLFKDTVSMLEKKVQMSFKA